MRWRGSRRCRRIRWCCRRTACRFTGCMQRLAQLREHHLTRLDDVMSVVTGKTTAFAIAQEAFPRVLYANPRQAFGESLAHLNMLASMGRLRREVDADGAIAFAPV